jgi:phospholipase C
VQGEADSLNQTFRIDFSNIGKATAVFHVRSGNAQNGPWTYTLEPGTLVSDRWKLQSTQGVYDLSVYGPNGFLRAFKGSTASTDKANLDITTLYYADRSHITLEIVNHGPACQLTILDTYTKETTTHTIKAGDTISTHSPRKQFYGWYDFVVEVSSDTTFQRRIAGHVETGEDSMTDPAIGTVSQ